MIDKIHPTFFKHMDSDLLRYIIEHKLGPGDRIPALSELSEVLNISVSKLREQLEVARILGLVEVRPRTGIRCKTFDVMPALRLSLFFALAGDRGMFDLYSNLRIHVEAAYWQEAIGLLQPEDKDYLRQLVQQAWAKLHGHPSLIPHEEHRRFHMGIFCRLNHPFVRGILEAYWEAYEAIEFNRYSDYDYLEQVWRFHERIIDEIEAGNDAASLETFIEHTQLLRRQPNSEITSSDYYASSISFRGRST
jgi:DNA-binding FadR family transcriptional regulator